MSRPDASPHRPHDAARPLRILQVANGFPPDDRGGVETYTRWLCAALRRRGHEVAVFCRVADDGARELATRDDVVDGMTVRRVVNNFERVAGFADYYHSRAIEDRFAEMLDAWAPDVVHAQHAIGLSGSVPARASADGRPTVWTLWDYWPICPKNTLLHRDGHLCAGTHHGVNCFACLYGMDRPLPGRHVPADDADAAAPQPAHRHPLGLSEGLVHRLRRVLPRAARLRLLDAYNLSRRLADAVAAPARALRGAPSAPDARWRAPVARRADAMRGWLTAVDRLVAPLPFVRDAYVEFGVPAGHIVVSEPGMDLAAWRGAAATARGAEGTRGADGPVFGYIGSLMAHKGVDLAVRAFRRLAHPTAELRLHGFFVPGDPYGDALRRLAAGDGRIRFMGPYDQSELPGILAGFDVMLMPAVWHETFSFVTREAILAGVPVVAARMGGMRAAIEDGVNGRLLPAGDEDAWAAAIADLALDPGRRAAMAAAQRSRRVRSIDEDAEALEAIYRAAIARRGGAPPPPAGPSAGSGGGAGA